MYFRYQVIIPNSLQQKISSKEKNSSLAMASTIGMEMCCVILLLINVNFFALCQSFMDCIALKWKILKII